MIESSFRNQVSLLLEVIEDALKDGSLALKGGTAINLFYLNMPRLSVDIDLAYLPINTREEFVSDVSRIFAEMKSNISKRGIIVELKTTADNIPKSLIVKNTTTNIKVEINLVLRGYVYKPTTRSLCDKARQDMGVAVSVNTLSFEDVYAGKFCAALDRQHPRDLFDVMIFFQNNHITTPLKNAFLVYLMSGSRPISELIQPNRLDIRVPFEKEFIGMTDIVVSYEELEAARETLIRSVDEALTDKDRLFLISFKSGNPNWSLLDLDHIETMPAIKWKQHNLTRMTEEKRNMALQKLRRKLQLD